MCFVLCFNVKCKTPIFYLTLHSTHINDKYCVLLKISRFICVSFFLPFNFERIPEQRAKLNNPDDCRTDCVKQQSCLEFVESLRVRNLIVQRYIHTNALSDLRLTGKINSPSNVPVTEVRRL